MTAAQVSDTTMHNSNSAASTQKFFHKILLFTIPAGTHLLLYFVFTYIYKKSLSAFYNIFSGGYLL
jgi:hypothetical protein